MESQQNFSPPSRAESSAHADIYHIIMSWLSKCKGCTGGISAQELDGSDQVLGGHNPRETEDTGQYGSEQYWLIKIYYTTENF